MSEEKKKRKVGKLRNKLFIDGCWVEAGTEVTVTEKNKEYIEKNTIREV